MRLGVKLFAAESSQSAESTVKTTDKQRSADGGPVLSATSMTTSSNSQISLDLKHHQQQQQQQSVAGYYCLE